MQNTHQAKMSNLLIDNWTIQCVGTLLSNGLVGGTASELEVAPEQNDFSYKAVPQDALNVRCLFQVLNNLVFTDALFVEGEHADTWRQFDELETLYSDGLVIPKPFQDIRQEWLPIRQCFVEELCVCPIMREHHEENVRTFKESGRSADPYFGQLIWGGAGMLARAHVLSIPYNSHPVREAWFGRVDSLFGLRSAERRFREFVAEQRVKVLNRIDSGGYLVRLHLPPIAALAIQEAQQPGDLLKIALQLREQYASLRQWLSEFQTALDTSDTHDLLAREKLLQSVARHIDAHCSAFPVGDTTVQIGVDWLKTTFKSGDPINSAKNLVGVRALMNRLVLAPAGGGIARKLAKLFGEEKSRLGRELETELGRSVSMSDKPDVILREI